MMGRMKAEPAHRIAACVGRALKGEVNALLLISAFKWLIYWRFTSQQCVGRPLHAHWKMTQFCVNSLQLLMWNSTDYALGCVFVIFIISALAAFVLSRFLLEPPLR